VRRAELFGDGASVEAVDIMPEKSSHRAGVVVSAIPNESGAKVGLPWTFSGSTGTLEYRAWHTDRLGGVVL